MSKRGQTLEKMIGFQEYCMNRESYSKTVTLFVNEHRKKLE